MKITNVAAYRVRVPIQGDYRMARGTHKALDTLIVRVETDAGVTGTGDSHQGVAGYTPETLETMHAVVAHAYGPALIGQELDSVERLNRLLTDERKGNPFARSAVEMALFDAWARSLNVGIVTLLGGPVRRELQLSGGIGIETPEMAGEKIKALADAGYQTVKVKIGTSDIQADIARVRAARAAVGEGVAIRADANAGYSLSDAMTVLKAIGDLGLELVEQPVAPEDIDGMVRLRQLGAVPIMADESAVTPQDVYRLIRADAVDAVKIKITKVGGYINARKIIDLCEAAGVKLVIGQGLCSSLESAGEAQIACAYEHVYPVGEMVGPAKLSDDLTDTPMDLSKGVLTLPDGPGIGVDLSEEKLRRYTIGGAKAREQAA